MSEGPRVGKYHVIARLGQGGMGVVSLGLALGPDDFWQCAVLKSLRPEHADDEEYVAMFADEARLAARLQHPNVVRALGVEETPVGRALALEYLEGQTLGSLCERVGHAAIPLGLHVFALSEVLAGLHYAHELSDYDGSPMGVVHRDVSPHNVFVTYDGQVKVLDFGIAKAAKNRARTRQGMLKGKLSYMAPEQAAAAFDGQQAVDRRADVYAVGAMLWEALAGRWRTRDGAADEAILAGLLVGGESGLRKACPDANPVLAEVCERAIAHEPAKRFPTAQAFRQALLEGMSRLGGPADAEALGAFLARAFADERREMRERVRRAVEEHAAAANAPAAPRHVALPPPAPSRSVSLPPPPAALRPGSLPPAPNAARPITLPPPPVVVASRPATGRPPPVANSRSVALPPPGSRHATPRPPAAAPRPVTPPPPAVATQSVTIPRPAAPSQPGDLPPPAAAPPPGAFPPPAAAPSPGAFPPPAAAPPPGAFPQPGTPPRQAAASRPALEPSTAAGSRSVAFSPDGSRPVVEPPSDQEVADWASASAATIPLVARPPVAPHTEPPSFTPVSAPSDKLASATESAAPPRPRPASRKRVRDVAVAAFALALGIGASVSLSLGLRSRGRELHADEVSRAVASAEAPAPSAAEVAGPARIRLSVTASPPGASVYLDDHLLVANPFVGSFERDGRRHRVRATFEGHAPVEQDVAFDRDLFIELALSPAKAPSVEHAAPVSSERGPARLPARPPKGRDRSRPNPLSIDEAVPF